MQPKDIYVLVLEERARQNAKWGRQEHSYPEWISLLTEEVGEAATEANKCNWAQTYDVALRHQAELFDELIQCAAVVFQIIEGMAEEAGDARSA